MNRPTALFAGLASAAVVAVLGISGGSYDVVDRQTAGIVLWWLCGVAALVVPGGPRRPGAAGVGVLACAALLTAWIALGLGTTLSTGRTADEIARWIVHLAPLVLLGWVLPRACWRPVLVGAVTGAVLTTATGFVERLWPGTIEQTPMIISPETGMRLSVPLGYWNAVGNWGVMTALVLLAIAAHAPTRLQRAAAAAPLPMVAAVIYCSYSRSALLTAAIGVVALVALGRNRWTTAALAAAAAATAGLVAAVIAGAPEIADQTGGAGRGGVLGAVLVCGLLLAGAAAASPAADRLRLAPRRARITFAVGATAALLVAGVVGAAKGPAAWDRFTVREGAQTATSARLTDLSNGSRVEQWRVALDSYRSAPGRGQGAGTFELIYNRAAPDYQFVRDAHSAPLEALAELGAPGLVLLLGLMASIVWVVFAAARRAGSGAADRGLVAGAGAAISAFLIGSCFDWFWELTALAMLALILVGCLIAAGAPERAPAAALPRRGSRAATATVSLLAVLALLPGLVGTSEIRRSQQAVGAGDLAAARRHADQAIDAQPWASAPYLQRGLVDERAGTLRAARDDLRLAIERDPEDWRLPLVLSRIEAKADRPEAALDAYRRAKELRPKGQFFFGS